MELQHSRLRGCGIISRDGIAKPVLNYQNQLKLQGPGCACAIFIVAQYHLR